jgi:hypothetical protein
MIRFTSLLLSLLLAAPAVAQEVWVASNQIRVIDFDQGKEVAKLPLQRHVRDIVFDRDAQRAYVAASDGLHVASVAERNWIAHPLNDRQATALSMGERYLATLTWPNEEGARVAREAGQQLVARVHLYDLRHGAFAASFAVEGQPMDLALLHSDSMVYLLDRDGATLRGYRTDGRPMTEIAVGGPAPLTETGHPTRRASTLALGRDGATLLLASSDGSTANLYAISTRVDDPQKGGEQIRSVAIPGGQRVRYLVRDGAGDRVWLSSLNTLYRYDGDELVGQHTFDVPYTSATPLPGKGGLVLAAVTFNAKRGSGGVTLLDPDGRVLKSVELPDLSPFVAAVRPR